MEVLTASRLRTFRECSRLHRYRYTYGLRPRVESDALRFGSLMHLGLAAFWTGGDMFSAMAGEADDFERAKAEELMLGYATVYTDVRDEYEVLAVEQAFEMPLLNPETMAASRTYRVGGKVDGVLKHIATGRTSVMEHKTTSSDLTDADYWAKLDMDQQVSIYVMGAESLGYAVDDTLYDVIKKPGIRPLKATPPESRKYTAQGFLYANQRERDETAEEFRMRLRADIAAAPEKYFKQRTVTRMNSQIQDSMADMWQTAAALRSPYAPRNPDACFKWGSRCPFWTHCTTGSDPRESDTFRVAETMHEELA